VEGDMARSSVVVVYNDATVGTSEKSICAMRLKPYIVQGQWTLKGGGE